MRKLLCRTTITFLSLLIFRMPAQAQADSAVDAATRSLVESIFDKSGLAAHGKAFPRGTADGTQSLGAQNQQSVQSHLDLTPSGADLTVSTSNEKRTTTYSGISGSTTSTVHASNPISLRTAVSSRMLYFPVLELLSDIQDSRFVLSLAASEQVNGRQALVLNISTYWLSDTMGQEQAVSMAKLYVDAASFAIIQRTDTIYDTQHTAYTRTFQYSDYRLSGQISVPFAVTESMNGQVVSTTSWNNIALSF